MSNTAAAMLENLDMPELMTRITSAGKAAWPRTDGLTCGRKIMKYVFDCGCTIDQEDIARHVTNRTTRWTCPDHKSARAIGRITYCRICNSEISNSAKGSPAYTCPKCQAEARRDGRIHQHTVWIGFTCGCVSERYGEGVRYVSGKIPVCAKHGASVEYRQTACDICGESFKKYTKGKIAKTCGLCRGGNSRDMVTDISTPRMVASMDRSDCCHRDDCLTAHMSSDLLCLPCLGCKRYVTGGIKPVTFAFRDSDPELFAVGYA
jgi:hypothetical protein